MEIVALFITVVIGAGIVWLAFRLEPHWVSKDGRRFICRGQLIDERGNVHGRWNEYRLWVTDAGYVAGSRRSVFARGPQRPWKVTARSDHAPGRRAVYLMQDPDNPGNMLAIRLPRTSRAIDVLDDLLTS